MEGARDLYTDQVLRKLRPTDVRLVAYMRYSNRDVVMFYPNRLKRENKATIKVWSLGELQIGAHGWQAHSFVPHEHLVNDPLDDPDGALTLLARQRRRDSEADAEASLDELLPAQSTRRSDPHALRECLVHDVLQQALLAHDIERRCRGRGIHRLRGPRCGRCRRTQLHVDDRRGGGRGDREDLDAAEHCADRAHVLL